MIKEVVCLLTFSEGFGATIETAMWEPQSTLFLLSPELFFSKPRFLLKKVRKHNVMYCAMYHALYHGS